MIFSNHLEPSIALAQSPQQLSTPCPAESSVPPRAGDPPLPTISSSSSTASGQFQGLPVSSQSPVQDEGTAVKLGSQRWWLQSSIEKVETIQSLARGPEHKQILLIPQHQCQ